MSYTLCSYAVKHPLLKNIWYLIRLCIGQTDDSTYIYKCVLWHLYTITIYWIYSSSTYINYIARLNTTYIYGVSHAPSWCCNSHSLVRRSASSVHRFTPYWCDDAHHFLDGARMQPVDVFRVHPLNATRVHPLYATLIVAPS